MPSPGQLKLALYLKENQLLSSELWHIHFFLRSWAIFQMADTWISKQLSTLEAIIRIKWKKCYNKHKLNAISVEILDYQGIILSTYNYTWMFTDWVARAEYDYIY